VIVLDSSVAVYLLGDDEAIGDRMRRRVAGQTLIAPELLDLEVLSAWRRVARAGRFPPRRAQQALDDLDRLAVRRARLRLLIPRIWELRDNLSAYDASYVALAEALDAPLLTADARLTRATGPRCRFELVS
jgi:predicted nucleic acid-binding protein